MAFSTRCPECQAKLTLEDTPDADESIECPKCGNQFTPTAAAAKSKKKDGGDEEKPKKKGDKKKKSKEKEKAAAPAGPKKRKTKKKKSNPIILYLMAGGGLVILAAVIGIGYFVFGRVGKAEAMLSHVPGDFNLVRGMNVGLIARYPGYMPTLDPQFKNGVEDVANELAIAAGGGTGVDFVDYAIHAKKKDKGLSGQVIVIRTRQKIDGKAIGAKLGAESNLDGMPYYKATGRGLMNGAIVYSPSDRLIVVVPATGSQEAIFRASAGGPKAKDGTLWGKMGDAGKKISSGHIWTMVIATGDLSGYISAMGAAIKKDFPKLGGAMGSSKYFGQWVMFGTSVKVGMAVDTDTKDTASEIATALKEGPLGKGDDSEMPNESKRLVSMNGTKEFKSEFLANVKYTYTGACVFLESKVNFEKGKAIINAFNNPFLTEAPASN